jgi:hypothetical protein
MSELPLRRELNSSVLPSADSTCPSLAELFMICARAPVATPRFASIGNDQ